MPNEIYNPSDYGPEEVELRNIFYLQMNDAKNYFLNMIKPRLDRSYKLYIAYTGDRQKEIQKWQCVSQDTEILGFDGWKKIGEIVKGDKVFSYNIENGLIENDEALASFTFDVDGEMVSIKNAITDQLVTTNHRVILKKSRKVKKTTSNKEVKGSRERKWDDQYEYIKAVDIPEGGVDYRLPVSGFYNGDISIGGDWAELIGWFLTDGCLPSKQKGGYITQSKPETLSRLRSLLISLGVEYREWSRKKELKHYHDEHRFYFPADGEVMKKMRELIPDRKPTTDLWHLVLSEKRRLLDGIFFGDGSKRPDGKYHVVSKPKKDFLEWLQVLVHFMGLRSLITEKYANIAYTDTVDIYGKQHIRNVKYKGRVWSITTKNTSYIARRNGFIFITGNSNIFVPYTNAVVETLMPRILDARPDLTVQGRTEESQRKAPKQQKLCDYIWEISKMDDVVESVTRSSLIYGTGFLQVGWKKDVRKHKFLTSKDILEKKYKYEVKEKTFYDAPYCEWIDNYNLWYDWHNIERKSKQFWMKRLVLTEPEIRRRYPQADPKRIELALQNPGGDLSDYASVRQLVKSNHLYIIKGLAPITSYRGIGDDRYNVYGDVRLRMYEVFEWWRPFDDAYCVMAGGSYVPILRGAVNPIPYDFKEAPFIDIPYLKLPNEFEGYGVPMLLENPQLMLNLIKNQRLDAATLSIHKMWIVNPLANINKDELVTRPFGIIYSVDPNGVREVQFSDIKASAYKEEDLLKADMRYSSGVDDFSMGAGGGGGTSATEVRHLRESTLERVRLFINHLGSAFSDVLRYWIDMERQFFTEPMQIRITGEDGQLAFPIVEKDDLEGKYDYIATVVPSIAGMNDIKKKQDMDLFQLLINLPFIDPKKLTSKMLYDWNWSIDSISAPEGEGQQMPGEEQMGPGGEMTGQMSEGVPPEGMQAGPQEGEAPEQGFSPEVMSAILQTLSPDAVAQALAGAGGVGGEMDPSGFSAAKRPINLLGGGPPPTVKGRLDAPSSNPRGFNRGGKVNTNINISQKSNPEAALMRRTFNINK